MPSVTFGFGRAVAEAAGMKLSEDGALLCNGEVLLRVAQTTDGRLKDTDYFDLIDLVRSRVPDDFVLVEAFATAIGVDHIGALGLAMKTAPTLRDSLGRIERYFRLVTDTATYRLDESGNPVLLRFEARTGEHPALDLRTECALASLVRNMGAFVEGDLVLEHVSFRHSPRTNPDRYVATFGCPVRFDADKDAIAMQPATLSLPNRLGDVSISEFLTNHLETEIGPLREDTPIRTTLMHRLKRALSSGIPQAADVARDMGLSERTLYRRLSDEGITFREVLVEAQSTLAQELLRDSNSSIAEIAFLTGFSEQSSFTRAFKRWAGQAPAQFRQQPRPVPGPPGP
ncbi:AraC family transcriptional regulator [Pyruvatibacter sp.]